MNTTPHVVFIAGCNRSGTTLLEILLERELAGVAVGEVWTLWKRFVPGRSRCGCGSALLDCRFWSEVNERYGGFERDLEAGGHLRDGVLRLRRLPGLLAFPAIRRERRVEIRMAGSMLRRLYRAVSEVRPDRPVIDSSKFGSYAILLCRTGGVDVDIVHLVRDPRAVAHSMSRLRRRRDAADPSSTMQIMGPARAGVSWLVWNVLVLLARRYARSYTRVRYEDLVASPVSVLAAVRLRTDARRAPAKPPHAGSPADRHGLGGNPMRDYDRPLVITADDEWEVSMSRWHRWIVLVITLPLAIRFGYVGRRGSRSGIHLSRQEPER